VWRMGERREKGKSRRGEWGREKRKIVQGCGGKGECGFRSGVGERRSGNTERKKRVGITGLLCGSNISGRSRTTRGQGCPLALKKPSRRSAW